MIRRHGTACLMERDSEYSSLSQKIGFIRNYP
jgi:hypothetical protein